MADEPGVTVVATTATPRTPLAAVRATKPDVIVLLSDPVGADVVPLVRRLRIAAPASRTVVLARNGDPDELLRLEAAGVTSVVAEDDGIGAFLDRLTYVSPVLSALPPELASARTHQRWITQRELEVLRLMSHGLGTAEIGSLLRISPRTVDGHRSRVLRKLGVHNAGEAVAKAMARGLISSTLTSYPP